MKITRIDIKDFQQFKDFTLDLTYPAGHPKAGEPLDKVCFIGQSGTGKTTILNVVNALQEKPENWENELNTSGNICYSMDFQIWNNKYKGTSVFIEEEGIKLYKKVFDWNEFDHETFGTPENKIFIKNITKPLSRYTKNRLIYLETGLENHAYQLLANNTDEKPLVQTESDYIEKQKDLENAKLVFETDKTIKSNKVFSNNYFRYFLLEKLETYDLKQREVLNDLFKQAFNKNVEKILQEVQKWKLENPNPRIEIDEKLRPILEKFNVKLDTEWADGGLKLKNLQDEEFDLPFASTGTKQILLSALPLLLMETAHKVILFDEPERSLFPDTQRELIDFYVNIAPESQFFFATHSPLIASQFEPWEIIELKFDEKTGKVYQEDYVKKGMERHVDNYRFYPKYMRWDSILTEIYDLDADGNEEREHALQELAQADEDIKYYKAQGDMEKVAELVKTYKALADKLLWKTNEND